MRLEGVLMIHRWHAVAAGAVALTLAIAGCGGSSGSSNGLSKAQLASKTDAICTSASAKVKNITVPSDLTTNRVAAAHYFDQIAPLYEQAILQFRTLKPASNVSAQWNDTVTKFAAVKVLVDDLKAKADAGDRSGIALLNEIGPLTSAANRAARAIGATTCGSG